MPATTSCLPQSESVLFDADWASSPRGCSQTKDVREALTSSGTHDQLCLFIVSLSNISLCRCSPSLKHPRLCQHSAFLESIQSHSNHFDIVISSPSLLLHPCHHIYFQVYHHMKLCLLSLCSAHPPFSPSHSSRRLWQSTLTGAAATSRAAPVARYHLSVPRARTLLHCYMPRTARCESALITNGLPLLGFNHILQSQGSTKHLQNSINVYFLCDLSDFYFYNIEKCILWIGLVNINLVFLLSDVNRTTKWTFVPFPIIFTQLHELDCQSCPAVWCKCLRKYKTQSVHITPGRREESQLNTGESLLKTKLKN